MCSGLPECANSFFVRQSCEIQRIVSVEASIRKIWGMNGYLWNSPRITRRAFKALLLLFFSCAHFQITAPFWLSREPHICVCLRQSGSIFTQDFWTFDLAWRNIIFTFGSFVSGHNWEDQRFRYELKSRKKHQTIERCVGFDETLTWQIRRDRFFERLRDKTTFYASHVSRVSKLSLFCGLFYLPGQLLEHEIFFWGSELSWNLDNGTTGVRSYVPWPLFRKVKN